MIQQSVAEHTCFYPITFISLMLRLCAQGSDPSLLHSSRSGNSCLVRGLQQQSGAVNGRRKVKGSNQLQQQQQYLQQVLGSRLQQQYLQQSAGQ